MNDYNVGDRVTRYEDIYNKRSLLMHGVIVARVRENERFPERPTSNNLWLYDVRWDNEPDLIDDSFFSWGIDPE